MKKLKRISVRLMSSMILLAVGAKAYAGQDLCEASDIHCAYIGGVSDKSYE